MKKFNTKKTILIATVILITGVIATASFAHMGGGYNMMGGQMGYGGHMMGSAPMGYNNSMMGYGGNMMGYGANGANMWGSLSADDQKKFQDQANAFFSETKNIREQSYKKQLELNQEFLKADKDQVKIDGLQKELFDLSRKFEEKRFNHMTNMQKIFSSFTGANAAGANFTGAGMGGGFNNC